MIKQAYQNGASAALKRFGVREASITQMLMDAAPLVGIGAAGATAKALAPGVFQGIERLKGVPAAGLRKLMPKAFPAPGAQLGRLGLPPGGGGG